MNENSIFRIVAFLVKVYAHLIRFLIPTVKLDQWLTIFEERSEIPEKIPKVAVANDELEEADEIDFHFQNAFLSLVDRSVRKGTSLIRDLKDHIRQTPFKTVFERKYHEESF
jgi:hypothetical protein